MDFITGGDRCQGMLLPPRIEDYIEKDNPVRVIDLFVDKLDLQNLDFTRTTPDAEGRRPFNPSDLLKLYLYGYMNGIRSSRKLATECCRNLELIWLLKGLQPKFRVIAYFRQENPKAIKRVFRRFTLLLKDWDLIGGKTVAVDGTKLRAVNSKKNNYNLRKIRQHYQYIDNQVEGYFEELDKTDKQEHGRRRPKTQVLLEKIEQQEKRKEKYAALEKQLQESDGNQISTTDPESRSMIVRGNIVEVAYNAQAAVDNKYNLVIDVKAINSNDYQILSQMAYQSSLILGHKNFTVLADKGYYNSSELEKCRRLGIETLVAPREPSLGGSVPTPEFRSDKFIYDPYFDIFTCPMLKVLRTNGRWYRRDNRKNSPLVKHYKTKACDSCVARNKCTTNKGGRLMERGMYLRAVEENRKRIERQAERYRQRQCIVEHPFGTIKRQWGFTHVLMKGIEHVEAELALTFTAYNMKRIISILGVERIMEKLGQLSDSLIWSAILSHFKSFLPNDYRINLKQEEQLARYLSFYGG